VKHPDHAALVEALCRTNEAYPDFSADMQKLCRIAMSPYASAVIDAGFVPAPWSNNEPPFDPWADNFRSPALELSAAQERTREMTAATAALSELNARAQLAAGSVR
jgi:hypothetical protein